MTAANMAIIMFLLIMVGYISRKLKVVDENFGQNLAMFLYNFIFPAIIIGSMNIPYRADEADNSISLLIISISMIIIMFILGLVLKYTLSRGDKFSGVMTFALMFPNFTFMAFPVMETLFPERGLFYISIYTIPVRFAIYVAGPLLMKPKGERMSGKEIVKFSLKALLTPPVIAIPIGILIYLTGITLPSAISDTLGFLSRTATPMGMAVTGILLAQAPIRKMFADKRLYMLTALRLIASPVIMFLILMNFNIDPVVFKISVIYAALPAAATTTVMAMKYKSDPSYAAGAVFMTTVLSVITVPLCAYILEVMV